MTFISIVWPPELDNAITLLKPSDLLGTSNLLGASDSLGTSDSFPATEWLLESLTPATDFPESLSKASGDK